MKKLILSVTLASITILSNAQIIKTNVLSTDKEGDEFLSRSCRASQRQTRR